MAKYIVVDIESPNQERICSLGLTVIDSGKIIETKKYMINPECEFSKYTIKKHGIHPKDVADSPTFDTVWSEICELISNNTVIIHNATYDLNVLHKTLKAYNIAEPEIHYICTLETSLSIFNDLSKHGLEELCEHFNITLVHHDAGSDSRACAELFLILLSKGLEPEKETKIFAPAPDAYKKKSSDSVTLKIVLPARNAAADAKIDLSKVKLRDVHDKTICLTGDFELGDKEIVCQLLENNGATIKRDVSKLVDILIVGSKGSDRWISENCGTKERKARQLQEKGHNIEIIHEKDFFIME